MSFSTSASLFLILASIVTAKNRIPPATTRKDASFGLDRDKLHLHSHLRRRGLTEQDISEIIITDEVPSVRKGVTHIYHRQTVGGITVLNGRLTCAMTEDNKPMFIRSTMQVNCSQCVNTHTPTLSPEEAIWYAAKSLGLLGHCGDNNEMPALKVLSGPVGAERRMIFEATAHISTDDIPINLSFFIVSECNVRMVYDTVLHVDSNRWLQMRIDTESGKIIDVANWVNAASYSVYPMPKESPMKDPTYFGIYHPYEIDNMTLVVDPEQVPGSVASPNGWVTVGNHSYDHTRGNNAIARGPGSYGGNYASMTSADTFDYRLNNLLSIDPSGVDWRNAAVTNMFYWTNILHDVLYNYGFDEASGNFQQENYSGKGLGNDAVYADAQDRFFRSNSKFSTPPDGTNPRLELGLWEPPNLVSLIIADTSYHAVSASFGPSSSFVKGKEVVSTPGSGCFLQCFSHGTNYTDKIVLISRGGCEYTRKVSFAQQKGAVAVIVASHVNGSPLPMEDDDDDDEFPPIHIPSVMISKRDGNNIGETLSDGNKVIGTVEIQKENLPWIDSSFDASIMAHEYGHGVSTRLTGGPSDSACLNNPESASEGWSDFIALFMTADSDQDITRTVGAYVKGTRHGLRPYPYCPDMDINPLTYAKLRKVSRPHGTGSIFGSCLWDLYWALIDFEGYNHDKYDADNGGNNIAMKLIMEGMKEQPCNPNFVDSRDGILEADVILYDEKYRCVIWGVFARRGLGLNAASGETSSSLGTPIEDFIVPQDCPSMENVTFWPVVEND